MKWFIPAKTFLVGEYVALTGGPAIVLTTTPCFEITLSEDPYLQGIHYDSPAGRWWTSQSISNAGLVWHDPYQGRGGMGASSAQFIGSYYASTYLKNREIIQDELFQAYLESAWCYVGSPPSGYDVLAQRLSGCVCINRQAALCQSYPWPFQDLAFIVLHTGHKLATHQHLKALMPLNNLDALITIAHSAILACEQRDSFRIIQAVNAYHHELLKRQLVASHSIKAIASLQHEEGILAVKGCGALGADVLLVLVSAKQLVYQIERLSNKGFNLIATSEALHHF